MSKQYLCYDLKGIQSFIFKIPQLKYIIGGSALIDQFDKKTVKELGLKGTELIFAGGGKGSFLCDKSALSRLKELLIKEAHLIGLDIRFGEGGSFSTAALQANELYSFVPDLNDGEPCTKSGLYPVQNGGEHPVIKKRIFKRGDKIFRYFEDQLLPEINHPFNDHEQVNFLHSVSSSTEDHEGFIGNQALGGVNRWAIIAMDGNDMGLQFRHQVSSENNNKLDDKQMLQWIKDMSNALDNCSYKATIAGIESIIEEWLKRPEGKKALNEGEVFLPVRPLVVGGDDIVVLCHPSLAMNFVKTATHTFNKTSKNYSSLWSATQGELTISSGILYAPVSLPLHTAIPYAEALLASAKTQGRKNFQNGIVSAPYIDWEHITDTIIDSPAAKRQREMFFNDMALDRKLKLTQRPYSVESLDKLDEIKNKLKRIANTKIHQVLPALSSCYTERLAFYAEIKKNAKNNDLYEGLNEFESKENPQKLGNLWDYDDQEGVQSTAVIDAILLAEEEGKTKEAVL